MKRLVLGDMNNVRDLGGYPCHDGYTKEFRFLRSGMPRDLKDKDLHLLQSKGITTIIDLRNIFECTQQEDPFRTLPDFTYHNCPMFADGVVPAAPEEMAPAYLRLATTPDIIAPVWEAIAAAEDGVLFHCTAGKDRTGVVAALLLWMVGVEKADILADYIATQAYVLEAYRKMLADHPDFPYFLTKADLSYIEEFYDNFTAIYSDPKTYLAAMGISELKAMRIFAKLLGRPMPFIAHKLEYHGPELSSELTLRTYQADDYMTYYDCYNSAFRPMRVALGLTPECCPNSDELLNIKDDIFILEQNGCLIGSVTVMDGEIDGLIVREHFRHQGIGQSLLHFAITEIQKRKHSPITLHVAEWNQTALRLYLNNNFIITESEIIQR
ncbi:MAG: GNAT family N-acetyltransferase [Clostridia bacterium]|nr:GNAT family N-acetyltransferase [Clostridia bacterium]